MMPNTYAGGTLDRAGAQRRDAAWVAAAWRRADCRIVALWRGQCLIAPDGGAVLLRVPETWPEPPLDLDWALLGLTGESGAPVFALDLSGCEQPEAMMGAEAGVFVGLRAAAPNLSMPEAALLAYAVALLGWRRTARFCGVCGATCRAEQAGHVSICTACATAFFPRTDPTVIMLVTRGGRALLGHNVRFPTRAMYSALAGFVEPGESLEEAVAREVMEETGVRIGAVSYHSSQPWPYPANLMLGFMAEALTDNITIDPHELIDARWFSRADLSDPVACGIELPPLQSIARRLIGDWLAGYSTPGPVPM